MVQLKDKKGFVQVISLLFTPAGLAIAAILAISLFVLPKIDLSTLSATGGFFDGYTYYDDFEKGYVDFDKWTYTEHTYRCEGRACYADRDKTCYDEYPRNLTNHDVGYIGFGGGDITDSAFVVSGYGFSDDYSGVSFYDGPRSCGGSEHLSLTPSENLLGRHLKVRLAADKSQAGYGSAASASLIMNGVTAYTCKNDAYVSHDGERQNPKSVYCTVEAYQSFQSPELYYLTVNGEEYGSVNVSNPDGDGKVRFNLNPSPYARSRGERHWAGVDYVKYKYPYGCKIMKDETLVFDTFSSGSEINLSTLSHDPVRFCLDYPVKARSFEDAGIKTDVRGEVLQDISRGKSVSVPNNEEWKFFYITKWEPGIKQRCSIDEAYDTQAGECVNPNKQAIIGCAKDSDCYIPDNCFGLSAQCVDWQCEYTGKCEPIYADYCQSDAECASPCLGAEGVCQDPDGLGKRCFVEGDCQQVQCTKDSDCPDPGCDGITVSCGTDLKCDYSGSCNPETITEYADYCQDDAECDSPCIGAEGVCKDPDGKGKRCFLEGECEQVQCETTSECPAPDCDGISVSCENYKCQYSGSCDPEIIVEKEETIIEKIIDREVKVDKCQSDTGCTAPCEGMSAYCKDVGFGKECHYSGTCQKEAIPCSTDQDCPAYARCANDVCVMTFNTSTEDPSDPRSPVSKPDRGLFTSVWTWFKGLFV